MRKKTKLLLEENNRAEEVLSKKGQELLTVIVVYLRGSRISTWEQEQVRRDITQMLRDADCLLYTSSDHGFPESSYWYPPKKKSVPSFDNTDFSMEICLGTFKTVTFSKGPGQISMLKSVLSKDGTDFFFGGKQHDDS